MLRIGTLTLSPGGILAPMAGVTDLPFRLLCREQGSVLTVTEMVSAKGYLCAPENRRAVQALLAKSPQEEPVALQLFGHEPDIMAEAAARLAERGFAAIDLNMGCPAPKITGGGDGSALLRDIPLAGRIIAAVRRAVALPLTVKMRTGWDEDQIVAADFARMAESEGADAIAVHGRTRAQFYAGRADWTRIAEVKEAVGIPVIGNGDVVTAADALGMMRETGCDGVMIGRGALGNPWIFAQIRDMLRGGVSAEAGSAVRVETAVRHARMLMAWKGEAVAMREMRKHGAWYTRGLHGAVQARRKIQDATTLAAFEEGMKLVINKYE